MSQVRTRCPYCGAEYSVEERYVAVVVRCATCKKPFQVSPIFAADNVRIITKPRHMKLGLVIGSIIAVIALILALTSRKENKDEFVVTKADAQHYRRFCEVMQRGDVEASIRAMRDVPPGASAAFRAYMETMADELSGIANLMKQLEAKMERTSFAKIWEDERVLAGVHPNYSIERIIRDSHRVVDGTITELTQRREKRQSEARRGFKNRDLGEAISAKLYDELIRVCYMYKGIFKNADTVYRLYKNNEKCWHEEYGDIVVTDRRFVTKINTAMRTLRESSAAMLAHCQSKERAGINQARRAVDQLEREAR